MNKKIKKLLIANRSEISSRIIFTCKSLGIKVVAIYSKEDQFLPYIHYADENYPLSKNGPDAYLEQDEIIKIALDSKANAIHPGYGFLSENASFAQKVIDSGLIWIGPPPKIMMQMSDKISARKMMKNFGIPIIPGIHLKISDKHSIKKIAKTIGFPLLLKNPLEGGGKSIRKVNSQKELKSTLGALAAKKLSHSNHILIENYLTKCRHIEIQIAGDGENFIHLYERECSIQRRHQKIIEEAPCSFLSKNTLENMYSTALQVAKNVHYKNIGTVEFAVTPEQKIYFLEMNTRLQVEHSVTELTTGVDLIAMQIQIAETGILPYKQEEIARHFHAIECRIYSEDPSKNFAPSSGKIKNLQLPFGPFVRHDHNLEENQTIPCCFDPMLSKITTWGKNRQITLNNMVQALNQFEINGVKTNISLLKQIFRSKEFLTGNIHTQLLNEPAYQKKIFAIKTKPTNKNNILTEDQICSIMVALFYESKLDFSKKEHLSSSLKNKTETNYRWRDLRWG